eukprot:534576_1
MTQSDDSDDNELNSQPISFIPVQKNEEEFEVQTILNHRKGSKKTGYFYLLKWDGWEEATWEHESQLENCGELVDKYWNEKKQKKKKKKLTILLENLNIYKMKIKN